MEIVEITRLCYQRGWRDRNLITMVAVIGAESGYNPEYVDDQGRCGLWALRPERVETTKENLLIPNIASQVARRLFEDKYFMPWISFATGTYYEHIRTSIDGMRELYLEFYKHELDPS